MESWNLSGKENSREGTDKRFPFSIAGSDDPKPVGGPLEIIDPTSKDPELVLKHETIVRSPDSNRTRDISGSDPLAVGRVASHGSSISMFSVYLDVFGSLEAPDQDGAAIAVENGVGFGVAGDQNAPASFCGGNARKCLDQFRHLPTPVVRERRNASFSSSEGGEFRRKIAGISGFLNESHQHLLNLTQLTKIHLFLSIFSF